LSTFIKENDDDDDDDADMSDALQNYNLNTSIISLIYSTSKLG